MRNALLTAALLTIVVPQAAAHHSFAVFFDDTKSVTVSGSVTEFRFTNPHAIIEITRKTPQGQIETWRAETNAVTLLRRRGWTAESLKVGEHGDHRRLALTRRLPLPPGAARRQERRDRSGCPSESAGGLRTTMRLVVCRRRMPRCRVGGACHGECSVSGASESVRLLERRPPDTAGRRAGEGASAEHGGPG